MLGALRADGLRLGLQLIAAAAVALERPARAGGNWTVALANGQGLQAQWLVICGGLGSPALLDPLGHERPQAPVLGQALELQLPAGCPDPGGWPGSISWNGINLVPRANGRLWLGATVEPDSDQASAPALAELRLLGGQAPAWLEQATVLQQWQGLRARPCGRPAPLLEQLEPGLVLASGHYRNGVLLAPASAEWVAERIEAQPQD
jgi:D-amino-acid oxidase